VGAFLISALLVAKPRCDSDATTCGRNYLPCPENGNCSNGHFYGCRDDGIPVNGTHDIFCVLPDTEDEAAWTLTSDIKHFLKHTPVVSPLSDLVVVLKKPRSRIVRAVNFTGTHTVSRSGKVIAAVSLLPIASGLGVFGIILSATANAFD
jgi:hypothetical protein